MDWKSIIRIILPIIIAQKAPKLAPLVPAIIDGIEQAEDLITAKGTDKLDHVVDLTKTAAVAINTVKGKEVISPDEIGSVAGDAISTAVGITNLISDKPNTH